MVLMDSNDFKVLFVFAVVYVLLVVLGALTGLQDFALSLDFGKLDYTLLFLPIAGFFFIYLLVPYLRSDLGFGELFIKIFPLLFAIASYLAFYVAVYYFFGNQAYLAGVDISVFNLNYFDLFIGSSFIYFVLAGIGGWGARMLIENFDESNADAQ